jgi:hypothetical protein
MLSRRIFLSSTIALPVLLTGCDASQDGPSAQGTWRGKSIDVYAGDAVSLNWHADRAEISVNGSQIIIRDTAITLDGITKEVQTFKKVVIRWTVASVSVAVDGTMLFS